MRCLLWVEGAPDHRRAQVENEMRAGVGGRCCSQSRVGMWEGRRRWRRSGARREGGGATRVEARSGREYAFGGDVMICAGEDWGCVCFGRVCPGASAVGGFLSRHVWDIYLAAVRLPVSNFTNRDATCGEVK